MIGFFRTCVMYVWSIHLLALVAGGCQDVGINKHMKKSFAGSVFAGSLVTEKLTKCEVSFCDDVCG